MSERKQFTGDQLDAIAETIWGEGRFQQGLYQYRVPCPVCGSDLRVHVDQTTRRPPPRFRAICSVCGLDSSAKATDVEMRQLTDEEMDELLDLHVHGKKAICPACSSPMEVEELDIAGASSPHFKLTCHRCGTRGQKRLSSGARDRS